MTCDNSPNLFVGISSDAVGIATKTAWAVGTFSFGGFEEIVEIDSQHLDCAMFALPGHNGDFTGTDEILAAHNAEHVMAALACSQKVSSPFACALV